LAVESPKIEIPGGRNISKLGKDIERARSAISGFKNLREQFRSGSRGARSGGDEAGASAAPSGVKAAGGEEYLTYYHGTNSRGAASVRKAGIDLSFSGPRNDFGRGFYLTDNYDVALTRATQQWGGDAVVLEYRVPKSQFEDLFHLRYDGPTEQWANSVRTQRTQLLDNGTPYDVISGPMWKSVKPGGFGADGLTVEHWPWPAEPQISIHSDRAIKLFNGGLQ